jgi:hypothetical protein
LLGRTPQIGRDRFAGCPVHIWQVVAKFALGRLFLSPNPWDPAEMTLTQRVLTYAPEKSMRIVNDATH